MVRSRRVRVGRLVGGTALLVTALGAPAAQAVEPSVTPEPAAAQFPGSGDVDLEGGSGLYAVGGGLVVAAGGAAMWLRRRRTGRPGTH
ncbi:hypothetical protein ACIRBX_28525 [Kitasatospora sp. NPDC096147]|uniref:hypothetical protein n=1 Tax=Kitasatospora sp. NPDC096147 TaxID=3364093 RepID=UPI00380D60FA